MLMAWTLASIYYRHKFSILSVIYEFSERFEFWDRYKAKLPHTLFHGRESLITLTLEDDQTFDDKI